MRDHAHPLPDQPLALTLPEVAGFLAALAFVLVGLALWLSAGSYPA